MAYIWLTDYIINMAGLVYHYVGFLYTTSPPIWSQKVSPFSWTHLSNSSFHSCTASTLTWLCWQLSHLRWWWLPQECQSHSCCMVRWMFRWFTQTRLFSHHLCFVSLCTWMFFCGSSQMVLGKSLVSMSASSSSHLLLPPATLGLFWLIFSTRLSVFLSTSLSYPSATDSYEAKGLVILLVDGVSLVNPEIIFGQGYVMVASDINYNLSFYWWRSDWGAQKLTSPVLHGL